MLFVTNKNDFTHVDRYDGVEYVFPPEEAVQVDEAAAAHMLGFGRADKNDVLVRLGWAFKYNEATKRTEPDPDGVAKLKKFIFNKASYTRSEEPVVEQPEQADLIADLDTPI